MALGRRPLTLPTAKAGGFTDPRDAPESRVLSSLLVRSLFRGDSHVPHGIFSRVRGASQRARWIKCRAWLSPHGLTFGIVVVVLLPGDRSPQNQPRTSCQRSIALYQTPEIEQRSFRFINIKRGRLPGWHSGKPAGFNNARKAISSMPNQLEFRNGCVVVHPVQCDCVSCLDMWAEWMEQVRARDRLASLDAELRQAKPATAEEWSEFFNAEFPRVGGAS